jgi:cysteinyl-tRNA synthetase
LLGRAPDEYLQFVPAAQSAEKPGLGREEIDALVAARSAAKKARNFAESDRIRDQLAAAGIVLEDTRDGTTWRRA